MKNIKFRLPLIVFGLIVMSHFAAFSQVPERHIKSDSIDVVRTLDEFVHAFTNLEWEKFTAFFAEDATAFFPPSSKFPFRANNKAEIENIFKRVFDNARKQKSAPPFLDIVPKDLKIQQLDSVAIVSFLLEDPELLGRRTLVLRRVGDKWKIVHLHASGAMVIK